MEVHLLLVFNIDVVPGYVVILFLAERNIDSCHGLQSDFPFKAFILKATSCLPL